MKFIIGIDPDCDKSGVASWNGERLILGELTLWKLFDFLKLKSETHMGKDLIVRLEAGHKNKKTWHKGGNGMAKRVGANNEIGRQIEKYCINHNIQFKLVAPCGLSNVNHELFCKITGWDLKVKTNPEKRVAGLLCWNK